MWRRLLLAAALVAPAAATPPSDAATCRTLPRAVTRGPVVRVCTQTAWLHAPAAPDGRVGNLAGATWSTTRPAGSLTGGAGAAEVAHPAGSALGAAAAATFTGSFTGPIDAIAFDLYVALPFRATDPSRTAAVAAAHAGAPELPVTVRLDVDGRTFSRDTEIWLYRPPDPTSRVLFKGKLGFTGLYSRTGPARRRHAVSLRVVPAELRHDEAVFLYDATEVASAVTFNAANLAGYSRVPVR